MDLETITDLLENRRLIDIKNRFQEMNEFDIAELIQELPEKQLIQAFRLLPKGKATDVFVNMEDEVQRNLISALTNKEATGLIEDMYSDDAADLFEEMPAVMVSKLLNSVSKDARNSINRLLRYPENSAGSLMATEYMRFKKGVTIGDALERIRRRKEDFVSYDYFFK